MYIHQYVKGSSLYSGVQFLFIYLPQISPHGRPRCGSGQPGVVAEKVPAAGSSASAPGLSCIWAPSGTLPLQATGLGTELAEGPQDHPGPSPGADDWRHYTVEGEVDDEQSRSGGGRSTGFE